MKEFIKSCIAAPKNIVVTIWSFIKSMFSENGDISSKRIIAVGCAYSVIDATHYSVRHYPAIVTVLFISLLAFMLTLLGLATMPQLITIWNSLPWVKKTDALVTDTPPVFTPAQTEEQKPQ